MHFRAITLFFIAAAWAWQPVVSAPLAQAPNDAPNAAARPRTVPGLLRHAREYLEYVSANPVLSALATFFAATAAASGVYLAGIGVDEGRAWLRRRRIAKKYPWVLYPPDSRGAQAHFKEMPDSARYVVYENDIYEKDLNARPDLPWIKKYVQCKESMFWRLDMHLIIKAHIENQCLKQLKAEGYEPSPYYQTKLTELHRDWAAKDQGPFPDSITPRQQQPSRSAASEPARNPGSSGSGGDAPNDGGANRRSVVASAWHGRRHFGPMLREKLVSAAGGASIVGGGCGAAAAGARPLPCRAWDSRKGLGFAWAVCFSLSKI